LTINPPTDRSRFESGVPHIRNNIKSGHRPSNKDSAGPYSSISRSFCSSSETRLLMRCRVTSSGRFRTSSRYLMIFISSPVRSFFEGICVHTPPVYDGEATRLFQNVQGNGGSLWDSGFKKSHSQNLKATTNHQAGWKGASTPGSIGTARELRTFSRTDRRPLTACLLRVNRFVSAMSAVSPLYPPMNGHRESGPTGPLSAQ
jgi:hypothetical protein